MDKTFSKRFFYHYDEMKSLYEELYNDEAAFSEFCEGLERYYNKRPEALRNLDIRRLKSPDWYMSQELSGIEVHMENDTKTFPDIVKELNYFKNCGYTLLSLGYILNRPKKVGLPGVISDFRRPLSSYGNLDELYSLASSCHRKLMKLCIDINISMVSDNHKWAKKACAHDKSYEDRFIITEDGDTANRYDDVVEGCARYDGFDVSRGMFTYIPEDDRYIMSSFNTHAWDLNYKNPIVLNKMIRNVLYMSNHGIDIFRIHDGKYVWKDINSGYENYEMRSKVFRLFDLAIMIVCPGTMIWCDSRDDGLLVNDNTLPDVIWHTLATGNCRLLKAHVDRRYSTPKERIFTNAVLDMVPLKWKLDYNMLSEECISEKPHRSYLNDYYNGNIEGSASSGMMSIAEMTGLKTDPDSEVNKRKYIMLLAFIVMKAGFPYIRERDEYIQPDLHEILCKLLNMRKCEKAFNPYADRWTLDTWDEGTLALGRYYDGEKIIAVFNFSDQERTAWINENDGDYFELITKDTMPAEAVHLPAYGYRILKKTF